VAGLAIAFICVFVPRGGRNPLVVESISKTADAVAVADVPILKLFTFPYKFVLPPADGEMFTTYIEANIWFRY